MYLIPNSMHFIYIGNVHNVAQHWDAMSLDIG